MTIHGQRADYIIIDDPLIRSELSWELIQVRKKLFRIVEAGNCYRTNLKFLHCGPVEANRRFNEIVTLRKITLRLKK
jgi:hypothetical protein